MKAESETFYESRSSIFGGSTTSCFAGNAASRDLHLEFKWPTTIFSSTLSSVIAVCFFWPCFCWVICLNANQQELCQRLQSQQRGNFQALSTNFLGFFVPSSEKLSQRFARREEIALFVVLGVLPPSWR